MKTAVSYISRSVKKFSAFITAPIPTSKNNGDIIEWGTGNDFPNKLIDIIYNSPTASSCINTIQDFIKGEGLNLEAEINNDTHFKIANDFATFEGFSMLITFYAGGGIAKVEHLPFECVRLNKADSFGIISEATYNDSYGETNYKKNNSKTYRLFDKHSVDISQSIYYFRKTRAGSRTYPTPFYFSGCKSFLSESKILEFHESNLDNNFMLSTWFKMIGDPDEVVERHDDGTTKMTLRKAVEKRLGEAYSGTEKAGGAFITFASSKEAQPELVPFPNNVNSDLFNTTWQQVIDSIVIAMNVPPVLANIQVSGKLGNTQEIINSVKLMEHRTADDRMILEKAYNEITGTNYIINKNSMFNYLPDNIFNSLSPDQKTQYLLDKYEL